MLGAIIGDMVGSPFKFDVSIKRKDFGPLFTANSNYSDGTVLTLAMADALSWMPKDAGIPTIRMEVIRSMREWGQRYMYAGYDGQFLTWLLEEPPMPYGGDGNDAAIRIAPAGWLYDTLERTIQVAKAATEITHNDPQGVKGAVAVAAVIFLARTGHKKSVIRQYVAQQFGYDLSRTMDQIRETYFPKDSCQETVPEAITAFLEGQGFEDVIRGAISLGGTSDKLAGIAGSMAEAFYVIPNELREQAFKRMEDDMREVYQRFCKKKGNHV